MDHNSLSRRFFIAAVVMQPAVITLAALAAALLIASPALSIWLKVRGKSKSELYDLLYSFNWGETTTNNYGFAPAEGNAPERFQLQMYEELYKLVDTGPRTDGPIRLLEISCGRGGGLSYLVRRWQGEIHAVGLDFSQKAIDSCVLRYADLGNVDFVCGSALALPFPDASFDVVVNVEASHVYGDYGRFFLEVHRVLRSGGAFLYADWRTRRHVAAIEQLVCDTGFDGKFRDITDHVVEACRLDSGRRRIIIRAGLPWYYRPFAWRRLATYAGIEGSRKFERFRSGGRMYFMTCLTKS